MRNGQGHYDRDGCTPRILAAIAVFLFVSSCLAAPPSPPISVDLHPYGFPGVPEVKGGVFYLSRDRLALFFEKKLPDANPHSHAFQLMVLNVGGKITAQLTVRADPNAMDIAAGPDASVLLGGEGRLNFYDSSLQFVKSMALPPTTTGIKFDRDRNQLVVITVERELSHQTAHFLNGHTLEESAALPYPITSLGTFGGRELVYTVSGDCKGSAHFVSADHSWRSLETLPACDALIFVTNDSLAYAFDGELYVVDSSGRELFQARIPAANTFEAPRLVGLSDDHSRLAISALKRKMVSSTWPYYDEAFVYDLVSRRMIFKHATRPGRVAMALSPDGHQLATIEQGALLLTDIK